MMNKKLVLQACIKTALLSMFVPVVLATEIKLSTSDNTSWFKVTNAGDQQLFQVLADGVLQQNGLTEAQRNAIALPLAGMMVFQTTVPAGLYIYDGGTWVGLTQATNAANVSSDGTQTLSNKTLAAPIIETATLNTPVLNDVTINNGSINNTAIGSVSAATANFTTLASSGQTIFNAGIEVKNGSASAGQLKLYEDSDDGTNKVLLQSPALTADYILTLPADAGISGEVLSTDGNGVLTWQAVGVGDVTQTGTQTLTNKTLTSPVLDTPTLNSVIVNGGAIDNASIGAIVAASANFTTLSSSGQVILNAGLEVKNGSNSAGQIKLFEDSDDGTNNVSLQVSALASDYTLTLPVDAGSAGEVLSTDGAGLLSWTPASAGDVTKTDKQILTNKTLTSPVLDSPTLNSVMVNGGAIDNASIGSTVAASANFTTLSSSGQAILNAGLEVKNGTASAGQIKLFEDSDDGINNVSLQASALASDYTLTLPVDAGTDGKVLGTDGAGKLSWLAVGVGDVTLTGKQVLTNKTLTSPTLDDVVINGANLNGTFTGAPTFSEAVVLTQPDINGGNIDGAQIGTSSASSAKFTTLSSSGLSQLNGHVDVRGSSGEAGQLGLYEDVANGTNKVVLQVPALAVDYKLILPIDVGNSGEVLATDGGGVLRWIEAGNVSKTAEQTLTNKTLTAPYIDDLILNGKVDGLVDFDAIVSFSNEAAFEGLVQFDGVTTYNSDAYFKGIALFKAETIFEVDASFSGNVTIDQTAVIKQIEVSGGEINNTSIGEDTPASGSFSELHTEDILRITGENAAAKIALYENVTDGDHKLTLQATAMASDVTLTLPSDDGDAGQVLSTDGDGNMSWKDSGGGGFVGARVFLGLQFTTTHNYDYFKIPFDTVSYDTGSNVVDGDFIAPEDGYYQLNSCVFLGPKGGSSDPFKMPIAFYKLSGGSTTLLTLATVNVVHDTEVSFCMSDLVELENGDVVIAKIRPEGSADPDDPEYTTVFAGQQLTYYSIHKVGS